MNPKKYLFELTPLGKADMEVRKFLEEGIEEKQFERYEKSLKKYRYAKLFQTVLKVLLYATIVTSVAAIIGLKGELLIIEKVASYIGTSLTFLFYALTSYLSMIRRESYHVQREILLSQVDWS